jgi:hypothetical protein
MLRLPPIELLARNTRVLVAVSGTITEVDADDTSGDRHQLFTVKIDSVEEDKLGSGLQPGDLVNVAVRYGDAGSLPERIEGLEVGQPIAIRGAFIPAEKAYPDEDGDRHAVIHFTHRPLGWIDYAGRRYR